MPFTWPRCQTGRNAFVVITTWVSAPWARGPSTVIPWLSCANVDTGERLELESHFDRDRLARPLGEWKQQTVDQ